MDISAIDTYNARTTDSIRKMERLLEAMRNDAEKNVASWAEAGTASHYNETISGLHDSYFREGEYAPENCGKV